MLRFPRTPAFCLALGFLVSLPLWASTAGAEEPLPQILIDPPPDEAPAEVPIAALTTRAPMPSPAAPSPPAPPTLRSHWYGWQALTVDGAAVIIALTSGFTGAWGGVGGLTTYAVGAPIVHMAHGHLGKGMADIGLRVGLPLLFGTIGYASGNQSCHSDGFFCLPPAVGDAVIGGLIGYAGAVIIDAAFLAREDVEVAAVPPTRERAFLQVAPDLQLRKDKQTLGLRGTF